MLDMRNIYSDDYRITIRRLVNARKSACLTQLQVAKLLDKPQSFVSKTENFQRRLDTSELKQLAQIYEVSIEELLS